MDFQISSEKVVFPIITRIGEYDLYTPTQFARSALRQESEERVKGLKGHIRSQLLKFLYY